MRQRNRQYTYRITTRGIDYVMNHCTSVPDTASFGDDWSIRRRHDKKYSPWNFEVWINDTVLVDRWTAKAMRRWRQTGYIVPHADMWRKHIHYAEALLSKVSIKEER